MSPFHHNVFVPNGASSEGDGDSEEKHESSCSRIRSFDSLRWLEYGSEDEEMRWLIRCVEAAGKGFVIGTGLKGGLALFSILARLRSRRSRKEGMLTNKDAMVIGVKETLRYGLFLGTFAGMFVSVDECIAAIGGHKRTAKWRYLLAGLVAGPSMLLTGSDTQHTSLALYILMRASVLASRCGIKSKRFGPVCKPMTWSHGDLFLMCLSSSQILTFQQKLKSKLCDEGANPRQRSKINWLKLGDSNTKFFSHATKVRGSTNSTMSLLNSNGLPQQTRQQMRSAYILKQDSLPSTYKSFLNKHGGKDSVILEGVKSIACGIPFTNLEAIESYYKSKGLDMKLDRNMKVPCSIVHGGQTCIGHFMNFILQAYQRAVPVYLPVYLFPALIVHRHGLLKRPYSILWKSLLGTARSSLFLSSYCASAWLWTCILFRIFKRCNIPVVTIGTFPTGVALAIEKKSRRLEISLYCFARALESFFTCMADAGFFPKVERLKRADVVVFSISTAIIMHCYAQERDVFRSKYLNVLDWVFGVPPENRKKGTY